MQPIPFPYINWTLCFKAGHQSVFNWVTKKNWTSTSKKKKKKIEPLYNVYIYILNFKNDIVYFKGLEAQMVIIWFKIVIT